MFSKSTFIFNRSLKFLRHPDWTLSNSLFLRKPASVDTCWLRFPTYRVPIRTEEKSASVGMTKYLHFPKTSRLRKG
jgi:hypothetical protein